MTGGIQEETEGMIVGMHLMIDMTDTDLEEVEVGIEEAMTGTAETAGDITGIPNTIEEGAGSSNR